MQPLDVGAGEDAQMPGASLSGRMVFDDRSASLPLRGRPFYHWKKQRIYLKKTESDAAFGVLRFCFAFALLCMAMFAGITIMDRLGVSHWWFSLVGILLAHLSIAVHYVLPGRRYAHALMSDRLVKQHCGACDFDLSGQTSNPDGCTLCPECGAAWKLPPREDSASTR